MLLSNHGYNQNSSQAQIPDLDNPLIFFNSNREVMVSIFGNDSEIMSNGYQNNNLSRPTTE